MDGSGAGMPLLSYPQIQNLLRIEFARARRYSYPLACLVLQIDGLDRIRDVHGMATRDEILQRVVKVIQGKMRLSDSIGLIQDRVAFLLPHTDATGARSVADRMREAVGKENFRAGGKEMRLSVSVGISAFTKGGTIFYDSVLKTAEAALAQAISTGGDRIEIASPVPGAPPD